MRIRQGLIVVVVALLGVWCPSPAMADSIQLQCNTCTSGSVTQMSNAGSATFSFVDVANQTITGNAFIAILVPTGACRSRAATSVPCSVRTLMVTIFPTFRAPAPKRQSSRLATRYTNTRWERVLP